MARPKKIEQQPPEQELPPAPPPLSQSQNLPIPPPPPPLGTQFVSRRDSARQGPRFRAYPGYVVIRVGESTKQEWEADLGNRVAIKEGETDGYLLNAADFQPDKDGYRKWKGMYLFAMTLAYHESMRQAQLKECYEKVASILPQAQQQAAEHGIEMLPDSRVELTKREITNPQSVDPQHYYQHMAAMQGVTPKQYADQIAQMYSQAQAGQTGPYTLESLSDEDGDGGAQAEQPADLDAEPATAGPALGVGAQEENYTPGPAKSG